MCRRFGWVANRNIIRMIMGEASVQQKMDLGVNLRLRYHITGPEFLDSAKQAIENTSQTEIATALCRL